MDGDWLVEVNNYSITNDATSMDISNMYTGVGQLRIDKDETPDSRYMLARPITLTDFTGEEHIGIVQQLQARDGQLSVVAEDTLRRFNVDKYINTSYFFDTETSNLEGVLRMYCEAVGVSLDFRYTPGEHFTKFLYVPGGKVNIWNEIKELAAVHKFDLWVEGNRVIIDNIGTREVEGIEVLGEGWSADISNIANWIEVTWFKNVVEDQGFTWQEDMEYYPRGNNEEAQILQVDANETVEIELEVNAWVAVWNQPSCVDWVDNRVYDNTNGVYSVVGNDNLPVTAAQWIASGGKLTVESTDDPSIVKIILKGANVPELAPFRIAMSSGNHYNSLHLTGWAYLWEKVTTRVYTGAGVELTSQEVGAQIESRNIQTLSQAFDVASRVAAAYAGPNLKLDVDTLDGVQPGTIVKTPDANFRVEQLDRNPNSAQASTGEATTFEDFNEVWVVGEAAEFEYMWAGIPDKSSSSLARNGQTIATNYWPNPKPTANSFKVTSDTGAVHTYGVNSASPSGRTLRVDSLTSYKIWAGQSIDLFVPNSDGYYTFSWWVAHGDLTDASSVYMFLWSIRPDGSKWEGYRLMSITDLSRAANPVGEVHSKTIELKSPSVDIAGYALEVGMNFGPGHQYVEFGAFTAMRGVSADGWFDGDTPGQAGGGQPTFQDFNYTWRDKTFQDFATAPLRRNNG